MSEKEKQLALWLDGTAAAVNIGIPDSCRKDVIAQLELNRALIAPLLDFEIPTTDLDN